MLAYYLTWHLRQAWTPLLFKDEPPPAPTDPVHTRNTIRLPDTRATFHKLAEPNPTQARALDLAEHATVLT
jgi:hypothetical protein